MAKKGENRALVSLKCTECNEINYRVEKNKVNDRRDMIYNLCEILEVVSINNNDIKKAVKWEEFKDFEDCLQEICAESIKADYIVTNNVSDFKMAKIDVLTAREFIMHCND